MGKGGGGEDTVSKSFSLLFNGKQGIKHAQLSLEGKILACFRCKNTYIEAYLNTLILLYPMT